MYTVYMYVCIYIYIYVSVCFSMHICHPSSPTLIGCVEKVQVVDKKARASTFRSEVASQSPRLFMSHLVLNLLQLRLFFWQVLK